MTPSHRQLRYFVALAEQGHFGRAAETVHISQPALSVQIRELEEGLGVTLFERQARRVALTPVGHEVLEHARRILAELRALEQTARTTQGLTGRLSIGVIPTVAPYLLPVALPLLRSTNVGLDLRVREAQTEVLLADLDEGRLDAAVIALPVPAARIASEDLFTDRFLLAGSQRQIAELRDQGPPRPDGLRPERLLLLDEGHCLADQALEACSLERRQTRVDLGASSLSTLAGLVAEGFGLTFLPEIAVAREMASVQGLHLMRFPDPQPQRRIGLVRRQSARGQGWFADLAEILRQAGRELTESARPVLDDQAA